MRTAAATLRFAAIALALGFSLSLSLPAQAQPSGFRGQGSGVGFQRERHSRQFQPQPQRQEDEGRRSWRDQRQGDGGAAANGGNEHPGRLSPEERRQLRRDIRDAGQDVYRPGRFERHRQ